MVLENKKLLLIASVFLGVVIFAGINFVSADFTDCWQYSGYNGGNQSICEAIGCVWQTPETDMWCSDSSGCCMNNGCWRFDGNKTGCEDSSINGGLNCTWDPFMTMYLPNGSLATQGACMENWSASGGESWGGMNEGCWQYDANYEQCTSQANSQSCSWKPNDANQNPWCWIKNLFDAQGMNPLASSQDIGCCDMKGCWDYDGNETQCVNNTAFAGLCNWVTSDTDPWCMDSSGCCTTKWCTEIIGEENCTKAKQDLYMPCTWNSATLECEDAAGSGFFAYNDTDSCMSAGGWWNASGDCEMPFGTGGGGFMFAEDAHCWFADNQPGICLNITGCIYCNDTNTAHFNVSGTSGTGNESSACYNAAVGYCQGHQSDLPQSMSQDIATDSLNCTHIQIKSACEYGPLPNCVWKNSSTIVGNFCEPGTTTTKKSAPPVPFCEHPDSKNNYTLCTQLAGKYMMPCKWADPAVNISNCTFNSNAVFGSSTSMEKEYEVITSDTLCVAAGGTWKTEYYLDNGALKKDAWCEKGALFDLSTGIASANKGNCNSDCWACEFNLTGGVYPTISEAIGNCTESALGYCRWTNNSNAPNTYGYCDYPKEMSYGAGDCNSNCKDCNLQSNPYASCSNSPATCKWVNETNSSGSILATGDCVSKSKKTCSDDCFSCYDFSSCNSTSMDCEWDEGFMLCKPATAQNLEICFDGVDNDGDNMMDCADPDCSFDMACGGNTFGDCMTVTDSADCNSTIAFGDQNCTWYNMSWESVGHCGMPGENCWEYDGNLTLCGLVAGCTNESSSDTMGGDFCDMNVTKDEDLKCWQYTNEDDCNGAVNLADALATPNNCTWVNSSWGGGWCGFWAFQQCSSYNSSATCVENTNCIWNTEWSDTGYCDVACFNGSLTQSGCDSISGGICEWRDSSKMCMPSNFNIMGSGSVGGLSGCPQYNGNYTACTENNYTCVWFNDSFVDNNVSENEQDGWCNSKGEYELTGDMKGAPIMLASDNGEQDELGIIDWVDIKGLGLRVTDKSYGFGMGIINLTNAAMCNGYPLSQGFGSGVGSGSNTTKFYWYLDTNGCWYTASANNCSSGEPACAVSNENGDLFYGFEFYIYHRVRNNTNTGNIETKKQLFRCVQNVSDNSGGSWVWVPTNVFISDDKKFSCFSSQMGAAFVTVEKESLENFPEFNITKPMTVLGMSSDGSNSSMDDSVGPAYYTPGTIDFNFVDCSNPDVKDPKCKSFQKFGFQIFEDCKNGEDDDNNGYADCADMKCVFTPACSSSAFDFTSISNDNKAPSIVFSKVDKMADAAIVMFDTDEPANGTLMFYNESSTCTNLNATLNDVGSSLSFDDYKPFHRIVLDSNTLGSGYLANSTTFYYKVKVCDSFNNCGTSKCLNFTTRKTNKNFIFRMDVPDGYTVDIPALNYSGNFTANVSGKIYDVGIKTNSSKTTNMNITVNYSTMSIKFIGADVYKPKTLKLDGAFIVDTSNKILGMNSSSKSWNMLVNDLGLGGADDYIELNFPVTYNSNNNLIWGDDAQTNTSDVSDYVICWDGGSSNTICNVPASIGFSVYQLSTPSSDTTDSTTSSSSGGSSTSGGGSSTGKTYIINEGQLTEGYSKGLGVNDRFKFTISTETHFLTLMGITSSTIKINITSELQEAVLAVGDIRKFELTGDNFYDLSVKLNSIANNTADLTLKAISEEITEQTKAEEQQKQEEAEKKRDEELEVGEKGVNWKLIVIIAIIVVASAIIGFVVYSKRR